MLSSVAVLAYEGVSTFGLGVTAEVFGCDRSSEGLPRYDYAVTAAQPGLIRTDVGMHVLVEAGVERLSSADLAVVVCWDDMDTLPPESVLAALRTVADRGGRVLSQCTGAFVLAAAGLLDGRRATTHWKYAAELATRYPRIDVDPGVLYVDEGDVLTSAGSAASVDLCLHVVERDYGAEVAARVARDLVVPLYRSGGQAQYIESPIRLPDNGDLFADTIDWLRMHLAEPVTVADLAERSAMSARTFARRFLASTGTTPLAWLTSERLRCAQRLLETSDAPVDLIARESGFGSPDNLRKHFARTLRTTPQTYRRTFRAKSPA